MLGGFLSRILLLALGYAYPAYECYKCIELNKPDIERLLFWCQYWILVALLTVLERFGDFTISWLPFYSEAKLVFVVYLWHPKMKGSTYIYENFFRPFLVRHEAEIDRSILEMKTRAGDMIAQNFQKAFLYGQTTFFEVLKYVASQSPPQFTRSRATQQQQNPSDEPQKPQDLPPQPQRPGSTNSRPPPQRLGSLGSREQSAVSPTAPKIKKHASFVHKGEALHQERVKANAADEEQRPAEPNKPTSESEEAEEFAADNTDEARSEDAAGDAQMEDTIRVAKTRLRKRVGAPAAASADAPSSQ